MAHRTSCRLPYPLAPCPRPASHTPSISSDPRNTFGSSPTDITVRSARPVGLEVLKQTIRARAGVKIFRDCEHLLSSLNACLAVNLRLHVIVEQPATLSMEPDIPLPGDEPARAEQRASVEVLVGAVEVFDLGVELLPR